MKAGELIQELTEGDVFIWTPDIDTLLQRCCNCGKWHRIELDRKANGDIHFKFISLDKEPEVEDYKKIDIIKGDD